LPPLPRRAAHSWGEDQGEGPREMATPLEPAGMPEKAALERGRAGPSRLVGPPPSAPEAAALFRPALTAKNGITVTRSWCHEV
jgi:hypothetical protein